MNVLGTSLRSCGNGVCKSCNKESEPHVICAMMTNDFLPYIQDVERVRVGDMVCVSATRWKEALEKGRAPPVDLFATHSHVLKYVELGDLINHSICNCSL